VLSWHKTPPAEKAADKIIDEVWQLKKDGKAPETEKPAQ
jgi:hypothetical protein